MHRSGPGWLCTELPRGGRLFRRLPVAEGRLGLLEARGVQTLPSAACPEGRATRGDQPGGRPGEAGRQRVYPVSTPCQGARLEVQGALCSQSSRQGPLRKGAGGPGPRERGCVRAVWPRVDTELKARDGDVVGTTCALV